MPCMRVDLGDGNFALVHYRGSVAKTWRCGDCQKRNPRAAEVCAQCGLARDGCPHDDADLLPARNKSGADLFPFTPGMKRWHLCSHPGCNHARYL